MSKSKNLINGILTILFVISQTMIWAQWKSLGSGISNRPRDIFSISAISEEVIWAVAINSNTGVSYDYTRSVDGGKTWTAGILPDSIGDFYPISIFGLDTQTAWIQMINSPLQDRVRLFKTTNGGTSWQEQKGGFNFPGAGFGALHFFNKSEGLGFGSPGTGNSSVDSLQIYRTTNGGEDWHRLPPSSLPMPLAKEGVWIYGDNRYASVGDTLWFGTRASRVFRTTDKGSTWQAYNVGISGNTEYPGLASIAFQNSKNGIATTYLPSQAATTTDGGETWTKIKIPPSPRAADILFVPGTASTYVINEGFLTSTGTSKLLISHDQGETWNVSSFAPALPVIRLLSPTIGFGGGAILGPNNGGIYKWTGDFLSSTEEETKSNYIAEVFPNPTKGKMTLVATQNYNFQKNATLTIHDAIGQNKMQVKIDSPHTDFDISELPNGFYSYQLTEKEKVLTTGQIIKL